MSIIEFDNKMKSYQKEVQAKKDLKKRFIEEKQEMENIQKQINEICNKALKDLVKKFEKEDKKFERKIKKLWEEVEIARKEEE